MFVEESLWCKAALSRYRLGSGSRVLDIGSSSRKFRTEVQPHISQNVHAPLLERGCVLTFCDIKEEDGVDLVVDIASPSLAPGIFEEKFDLIICCNILEHVIDRDLFLQNLLKFSRVGSMLLFTAPHKYPNHADPIDTMYRPNSVELLKLIATYAPVDPLQLDEISTSQREYYVRAKGRLLDYLIPFRTSMNLWRYYIRPFRWRVSCILAKVVDDGNPSATR